MPLARTIQEAYCEATEWNLATLEELRELKGTARYRVERQRKICEDMLISVRRFTTYSDAHAMRCQRLVAILKGDREP